MEEDKRPIVSSDPLPPKTEKTSLVSDITKPDDSKQTTAAAEEQDTGESSSNGDGCCATAMSSCYRVFCFPVTLPLFFIKIFYFSFIGGLGCVLPFLSIYFKQMGLSPEEIGIISGLRPLVGFLSGPLWGAIADRYNIRRIMLMLSVLAWVGVYVAIAFVPPPVELDNCPKDMHPHRDIIKIKPSTDPGQEVEEANGTVNITADEYEALKENIDWMYTTESVHKVFLLMLLLILLGEFFQSPTSALSDAGAIQALGKDNLDYYGSQRAWGPVGWAVSSLSVGALVSATRRRRDICGVELYFSNYFHFVYVFIAFMAVAFLSATQIKFTNFTDEAEDSDGEVEMKEVSEVTSADKETSHSTVAVIKLFLNVHYGSWLSTAFFVGVCNGIIWGFLYWHLDNLGADQLLIGVSSVVSCVSEFIMFFFVPPVIKVIGHMGVMYAGLFIYAIRFVAYASLVNPWWVLPVEFLQGLTFSIIWVSLTSYSALSVPTVSLATVQGILHGVYFGLGNGTGHLIGGSLIGLMGAALTFYSMAAACLLVLVIFIIAQKLSRKPDFEYQQFDDTKNPVK